MLEYDVKTNHILFKFIGFFFQNVLYTRKSAQNDINNENAYIYFSAHSVFLE